MPRLEIHAHTWYSNIRLLDCINKPSKLIDRAVELGLSGIAITDHECLSAAPEVMDYAEVVHKTNPDFKVVLGNEIYLCGDREKGQKYYHFILMAKNATGWRALRELSSRAWLNSFFDRGLERVVTTYQDLTEIVNKYPNSLVATTACLGGELSSAISNMILAEKNNNQEQKVKYHDEAVLFVLFCKKLFGDDFYIECAPGCSKDQIAVNQRLMSLATAMKVKMVVGTDAHYLTKQDRLVHKSYLNSKNGEREVNAFYEYSYLQSNEEIIDNLKESNFDSMFVESMFENSYEIWEKIENYSIRHKQTIPKIEVKNYPKTTWEDETLYPTLAKMVKSDDVMERYWVNECIQKLEKLGKYNHQYMSRLEEEADTKMVIGQKLETNMFAYPITLQHYIDMFWECGSIVGAGRGSSCSGLNHYLLGVTQLDPIEWNLPWFRYMNKERTELGDIDIDLCPSKRPAILERIKKERGKNFIPSIDNLSKNNLGCTLVATFGTEGTKSAILTACRGYGGMEGYKVVTKDEYGYDLDKPIEVPVSPIDTDEAQYMSSLIPSERGFLWPLSDVVNGNPEKGRKPIYPFIEAVNKYPGLLDIMLGIEGCVNKRSSHASGVIMFDEDPYEFGSFMRTPTGEVITAFELHASEALGMTKYDFLVTAIQDKIAECIRLMKKDNVIDKNLTLREAYNKYLHPSVLPINDQRCWKAFRENLVLDVFQFDSDIGSQAAKKIRPNTIIQMCDANGLLRLMPDTKGAETPMEKYIRFKNNIMLWYKEMDDFGLTKEEQSYLEPYFKSSYGVPPSQQQMMLMLMDEHICGFSIAEANKARKIVGKKQMSKIPELKEQVLTRAIRPLIGEYVWKYGIGPQMGYSFSVIHSLAYSFIGFQNLYLSTNWNSIYWNTACLIVNSGALEDNSEEQLVSIYAPEAQEIDNGTTFEDLPDRSGKMKRTSSTDYAKMAKALGSIISKNIKVSLIDINKSDYSFTPNIKNNEIVFGLKGVNRLCDSVIADIIKGRPYEGLRDFMNRCPLNKVIMVQLIKAGAFDKTDSNWASKISNEPRKAILMYYLSTTCDKKKKLTLSNFNSLSQCGLLPSELALQNRIFNFNKYLKNFKVNEYFVLDDKALNFYNEFFNGEYVETVEGAFVIEQKLWKRQYDNAMEVAKAVIKQHEDELIEALNLYNLQQVWNKYGTGTLSAWEMESVCFYYNKHELYNVNHFKYGLANFFSLDRDPQVEKWFERGNNRIPIYQTYRIAGTVISKNDVRSSIALLTTDGVVTVKFTKEFFAMYNRQLSEVQEDGTKKVAEKGWFNRGNKLVVTGFRRDDTFVAKTYSHTQTHTLYKIMEINNGEMELVYERNI